MKLLLITAFAVQVAFVSYAEDQYRGYRDTLFYPPGSNPGCFHLPSDRSDKVKSLNRISEGSFKGVFKKHFECIIQHLARVGVFAACFSHLNSLKNPLVCAVYINHKMEVNFLHDLIMAF
jgi:hypothetical protein